MSLKILKLSRKLTQGLSSTLRIKRQIGLHYPIQDDFFGLDENTKQLRQSVFQLAQKELASKSEEIDKNNEFKEQKDFWLKIGEMGLLGITASPDFGGTGASYLDHCIAMEEISRANAAVGLSYIAHSNLCVNQINRYGNDEQKAKYLPKLCSGEYLGALAMSEHDAGSDVVSMKATAIKNGDHYIVNGTKFWITNGSKADILVVYLKTDPKNPKPQHGISTFIIERGMEGFSTTPKLNKMGMRGSDTCELVFENCKVPEKNLMGGLNKGVKVLMSGLDIERLVLAAGPVGIMQAACDCAFKYVHERKAFGKKIGTFQMIQAKLADMYVKLNTSRSYLYTVARALDKGNIASKDCSALFLYTAECSTLLCLDAIQLLGGYGYINEYPTGKLLRDSKLYEIGGGTSEIRRLVIGRSLNDEYS